MIAAAGSTQTSMDNLNNMTMTIAVIFLISSALFVLVMLSILFSHMGRSRRSQRDKLKMDHQHRLAYEKWLRSKEGQYYLWYWSQHQQPPR